MPDGQGVKSVPLPAGIAQFHQPFGNRAGSKALVAVKVEDDTDNLRFLLIDGQDAVLFVIAIELVVAQHMTVFDGLPESEFQPLRQLPNLILGNPRHNHQPELAVRIQCVDVVVLEEHPHIVIQQLLGIFDAVQGRSGEPGNLLGDDEIEHSGLGIPDHPVKIVPLFRGATGNALIHIPRYKSPIWFTLNQLRIILHLIFQTIDLFILICGHPGIKCHPKWHVVKRPAIPHFSADFPNFHQHPPRSGKRAANPMCRELSHAPCRKHPPKSGLCPEAPAAEHTKHPSVPHPYALTS